MVEIPEEVIRAAARGDWKSFRVLYESHFRFVVNVAGRIVNNTQDAEDVTQEVFLNVYRSLPNFQFGSTFKTWLYRITVNTSLNYIRKSNQNVTNQEDAMAQNTALTVMSSVADDMDKSLRQTAVQKLLAALNPEQRTCLVLRSQEGLSYQQIAETLSIPINTVRTRIKRAREAMLASKKEVLSHEL